MASGGATDVVRDNVQNIYALSPMQEGLLFHALAEPRSTAYFQQLSYRLTGALDLAAFEASWNELVRRHDVLRTVFVHTGADRPLQVVLRARRLAVTVRDVSDVDAAAQPALIRRFKEADRARPFDLARDLLLRVAVLRLGPSEHEVVFSHHHIVMDGWSLAVLQAEFAEIYAALREGGRPALAAPIPYRRHIGWLEKTDAGAAQRYWREYLAGYTTVARVPERRASAAVSGGPVVATHDFALDAATVSALAERAAALRVTPSAVLHALWGLLLARYNGTADVVFGSIVSGRPPDMTGVERAVGLFINTVPVRVRIPPDATLAALVEHVQRDALAGTPHHHHPLARIQAQSAPGRNLLGTVIAVENYPVDEQLATTLGASRLGFTVGAVGTFDHTHWDLVVQFLPGASLRVRIAYDARRFHDEQIRAVEGHFRRLVEALLHDPRTPAAAVDILTPEERHVALHARGNPRASAAPGATLATLFEAQAAATPASVAVVFGDTRVTYAELNARANRLARRLRAAGVGADDPVALFMERSVEMVVGMLAVLKAGGAYLPLDPDYPRERLEFMLRDTAPRVVLTRGSDPNFITVGTVMKLGSDPLDNERDDNLGGAVDDASAAYVIYTSGSTGVPKGAINTHGAIRNRLEWMQDAYRLDARDRVLQKTPYSFDVSVWEFFWPLITGARLVVAAPGAHRDAAALVRAIAEHGVTVVHFVPSMLEAFLDEPSLRASAVPSLRAVICSGEALTGRHRDRFFATLPGVALENLYGPTEAAVDVTAYTCAASDVDMHVPIGRPIWNTEIHVLDERLRPVPTGVAGDLFIGGAGLARGYLGRPALTAERFVANPFARRPGERMYRSGDIARRTWDGDLEYVGRADHQVKIKGFRIEPGEIEARLAEHPTVRQTVVLAVGDAAGAPRLVAYVVPVAGRTVDVAALRAFLAERLPDHMVPAAFVALAALPVNANGKLDRAALPAPDAAVTARAAVHVAPRTPVEQALADVWATVLRVDTVGVHDDYFALGGDSITAIRIAAGLLRHGLALEIRQLLRFPTIAALAPRVTAARASAPEPRPEGAVPLTPVQARFFAEHTIDRHHVNQAARLRARTIDADALRAALTAVVDHHDAFRLRFVAGDGVWTQELAPGSVPAAIDIVDLRGRAGWREALVGHAGAMQQGFDLASPPLVRAALYRTDDGDELVLAAHHLVIDGVSWRILLEDLETAYEHALAAETPRLPAKTDSYQRWAHALHAARDRADLAREAAYWRDVVAGAAPELPGDHAATTNRHRDARVVVRRVSRGETETLVTRANAAYRTTTEDLLLTALAGALARWHGADTTLIALESHGREDVGPGLDVTRTVGWFTAVFPFALHAPRARDLGYRIKSVKESVRRVPRKGVGYGVLAYLGDDVPRCRPPVSVNYLGAFASAPAGRFRLTADPAGTAVSPDASRSFEIEVSGSVVDGVLELTAVYNGARFAEATIARVMDDLVDELLAISHHCASRTGPDLTPADLTYSDLTLDELDELLS